MELKVWVDGLQRVVCGLAERTTCQEVIYALAHATGKTGRFVLVEKWRTSERSLSPHDRPLELLSKWGEYSNDVQFVLRCLEDTTTINQQQQRPSAIIQQQQQRGTSGKFFSSTKNGQQQQISEKSITRHRSNNHSMDENNSSGQIKNINNMSTDLKPTTTTLQSQGLKNNNATTTSQSSSPSVLKPYFVDTSNPLPESGTLVRPSPPTSSSSSGGSGGGGGVGCIPTTHTQQLGYEVTNLPAPTSSISSSTVQQNFLLRRTPTNNTPCALSPTRQQRQTMSSDINDKKFIQGGQGSLTVLSQSQHDSLTQTTPISMSTTMDSSGTQICLENTSYSTTSTQPTIQKQMDLSQTSFCNSSLSSTTSNQSIQSKRPPPPSYDSFVMMHNRRTIQGNLLKKDQRSGQSSPLPNFNNSSSNGHYHQGLLSNRSRTPISNGQPPSIMQPLAREQLIKMIENQHVQLQAQFQAMRSFDNEISQCHQDPSTFQGLSSPPNILDHLRRELQQLEVERVHVKQKVEELRRQDLDNQLLLVRQNLSDTLTETGKFEEKLRSMDVQLIVNQEKMRYLNTDLEKEKQDILQNSMTSPTSTSIDLNYGLNDSLLLNANFESRIKNLDEILKEKRKQLDDGQNIERSIDRSITDRLIVDRSTDRSIGASIVDNQLQNRSLEMKNNRSKSFDQSTTAMIGSEIGNQQRQQENAAGVWV